MYGQQEADSTLTSEEIQFRDSIAAINTNNALIQEIQESYNLGTEAFASSNFKEAITFFESVIVWILLMPTLTLIKVYPQRVKEL